MKIALRALVLLSTLLIIAPPANASSHRRHKSRPPTPSAESAPPPAPAAPAPAPPPPPPPPPPKPERQRVMVLDVQANGVEAGVVAPLAEVIAWEIARHPGFDVASSSDVHQLMAAQQQKQALGCAEDQACLVEISRKLDADLLIRGSVGLVGQKYVLNLSAVNVKDSSKTRGAVETVDHVEDLPKAVPLCLAKAFQWDAAGKAAAFHLPKGKKLSFAVFDLRPTGLTPETAQNLTQVLSVEVKSIEGASVISREDIAAMLQLGAAKMAAGCNDDACMAEIGGALGVDDLITGDAGKLGNMFIVNLRLIDVRHAIVENRVTESYQGDEEQLLRAVRHAARELLGLPQTGAGRLAVTSNLNGASVFVDEQKRGQAPVPVDNLPVGRHLVRVNNSGYFDWQGAVYVDPSETTSVWAQLKARPQSWYQKWWVWTIAGAVVVGATATSVALTRPPPTVGHGTVYFP